MRRIRDYFSSQHAHTEDGGQQTIHNVQLAPAAHAFFTQLPQQDQGGLLFGRPRSDGALKVSFAAHGAIEPWCIAQHPLSFDPAYALAWDDAVKCLCPSVGWVGVWLSMSATSSTEEILRQVVAAHTQGLVNHVSPLLFVQSRVYRAFHWHGSPHEIPVSVVPVVPHR